VPTALSAESVNTVDGAGCWLNEPLRSPNAYVAPLAVAKRAMATDCCEPSALNQPSYAPDTNPRWVYSDFSAASESAS
jgi:hypothetical protein